MKVQYCVILVLVSLVLCSCSMVSGNAKVDPFAGDWTGHGADSQGNSLAFAAKVIAMGGGKYRVLILDSLDTANEPMHIMDGTLTDGRFPYTADGGVYTGSGTLKGDTFEGYYKGPVDGTFTMTRLK